MSEDEAVRAKNEDDDVEAHRHGKGNAANEEAPTEGEGDDDFEAHHHRTSHPRKL